jgi:preprotein translocase subunit SecB
VLGAPPKPARTARRIKHCRGHPNIMAEQGDILTDLDMAAGDGAGNGADTQPVAGIISQYVKDLSVENPNAPQSYNWTSTPNIDLQFNIGAQQVNEEIHEVELKIVVTAKADEGSVYLIELSYCGLVGMRNMADPQVHMFLYAEAPRILFPFARRIVADATRDAGFQPLMLDPIDFNGLYVAQLQRKVEEEAAAGGPPAGNA